MPFVSRIPAEQLAKQLDPRARPNYNHQPPWWNFRCPGHDDRSPSFGLRVMPGGWLRVKCRSGCSEDHLYQTIAARCSDVERVDLARRKPGRPWTYDFPVDLDAGKEDDATGLPPGVPDRRDDGLVYSRHWAYRDADGKVVGYAVRYDHPTSGEKQVVPYFLRQGKVWLAKLPKAKRIPYALHLLRGVDPAVEVVIVEGEKCADALIERSVYATTWPGGSSSVEGCDWGYLFARKVLIFPDHDKVGLDAAEKLRRLLLRQQCEVSVIDVERVPELAGKGADVVDYFDAGRGIAELFELPRKAYVDEQPAAEPDVEQDDGLYKFSDAANARRLARQFDGNVRWVEEFGWMVYRENLWRPMPFNQSVGFMAQKTAGVILQEARECRDPAEAKEYMAWWKKSQSLGALRNMGEILKARPEVWAGAPDFDRDDDLLCVKNGIVDLRTGKLYPHDRGRLMTRMCNANYHETNKPKSKRWLEFLKEIFAGDDELVEYMLSIIGYSLTGSVAEEVFFILYGTGKNGKSKLIEALIHVFAGYGRSSPSDIMLRRDRGRIPNDIARLQNVRMVVTNETARGEELDEARVKEMTGGDQMSARFLNKEFFDFNPKFKLWLRTNHLPHIKGGDEGIWRRIRPVPFSVEIPESRRDKHILGKLKADADAILTLAVDHAVRWYSDGLPDARAVTAELRSYRGQMDYFGSWIQERCNVDRENKSLAEPAERLFASYRDWATQKGLERREKLGKNMFGRELVARKFERDHTRRGSVYAGIELNYDEARRLDAEERYEEAVKGQANIPLHWNDRGDET